MRLIVPTNWDDNLIEKIKNLPIDILYAKLKRDSVGGGRPASALPEITRKHAAKHIRKAQDCGMKFNYVLNSVCIGNKEFIKSYRDGILRDIEWISKLNVDYVTVGIPYLMELIKKNFPQLKIVASVFLNIDSIQKALFYQNSGVKEIVVDQSQNRNMHLLENMRKNLNVDLQLVANNICLLYCPFRLYHQNINSHASQNDRKGTRNISDQYVTFSCETIRINNPEEIIKSTWIRPEDLIIYEKIGIDRFKISGRTKSTDWIVKVTQAYADRKSPNNFAELLSFPIAPDVPSVHLEIKNKYLSGFLTGFNEKDCRYINCKKCGYCHEIAKKAVFINPDEVKKISSIYLKNLSCLGI